jgi:hypothetical protein
MLDGRWKANIEKGLRPIGANLRKAGISADQLTAMGVVMAAGAAVAIGLGQLRIGLLLLLLTGLPDALDGAVERSSIRSLTASPIRCCWVAWPGIWPAPIRGICPCCPWPCWPPRW